MQIFWGGLGLLALFSYRFLEKDALKRCTPSPVIDRKRGPERSRQALISEVRVYRVGDQEPVNAPFLNGLFSSGFSRRKTAP